MTGRYCFQQTSFISSGIGQCTSCELSVITLSRVVSEVSIFSFVDVVYVLKIFFVLEIRSSFTISPSMYSQLPSSSKPVKFVSTDPRNDGVGEGQVELTWEYTGGFHAASYLVNLPTLNSDDDESVVIFRFVDQPNVVVISNTCPMCSTRCKDRVSLLLHLRLSHDRYNCDQKVCFSWQCT
jgi:hypothetical protein